jgi:hypothetical protein
MWILVFIRVMSGGNGFPHPLPLGRAGVGVGVGVGAGVGVGLGAGVAAGLGVGVPETRIEGIGIVRTPPEAGVLLGWVGSFSVIEWHPIRSKPAAATP